MTMPRGTREIVIVREREGSDMSGLPKNPALGPP